MSALTPEQAASVVTLLTCVRSVSVSYRGRNTRNSVAFRCSFIVPLDFAGITPEIMALRPLCGKEPHLLLRAGSRAARGPRTISGIPNRQNYCVFFRVYT